MSNQVPKNQSSWCDCKADGWCWCAQCAQFSTKVLGPLLRSNLSQYIEFNLVPYGNAKQTSKVGANLGTPLVLALLFDTCVLGSLPYSFLVPCSPPTLRRH